MNRTAWTTGVIAQRLGVPLHRVIYVIRSRKILPVAWAGHARIFSDLDAPPWLRRYATPITPNCERRRTVEGWQDRCRPRRGRRAGRPLFGVGAASATSTRPMGLEEAAAVGSPIVRVGRQDFVLGREFISHVLTRPGNGRESALQGHQDS